MLLALCSASAQEIIDRSLARHDFLYAGEGKQQRMYIVKDGQVVWQWRNPEGRGEISDAVLLKGYGPTGEGTVLVAHQYGICEVSIGQTGTDGDVLWRYEAPAGTEIHTIQPIGRKHVLFVQNGPPRWWSCPSLTARWYTSLRCLPRRVSTDSSATPG